MTELRATDVLPIDLASKLLLGIQEGVQRAQVEARRRAAELRTDWQRFRLWLDAQHLDPNLVAQLLALVLYGIVTVVEAWAQVKRSNHRHA